MKRTLWFVVLVASIAAKAGQLPSGVKFLPGPVNGLLVADKVLVYGDAGNRVKTVPFVLFTEARRDVVWAGAALVARGATAIVPESERAPFEAPAAFWAEYETHRFHEYTQVNTKVLREPVRVARAVRGGEALDLGGVRVEVIDTPGYTRGAVSYLLESGGKRIVCTGDLIYGDGQLFDLSSLQDAIPEAKAQGYHGYAARRTHRKPTHGSGAQAGRLSARARPAYRESPGGDQPSDCASPGADGKSLCHGRPTLVLGRG